MRILTSNTDNKIKAINNLVEMTIGEYVDIAKVILTNNSLQRRRVVTSNKTYSLLKEDIKSGCVIPPIVLAFFPGENHKTDINQNNLIETLKIPSNQLLILDGLQRTYTILDLYNEIKSDTLLFDKVLALPLRIEIYTGISKIGVLYRMLTLNTGQTPMSTRHQIEIIYSDYNKGFDNFVFLTEAENRTPSNSNEFRFSEIIDGFISYITGDYLPIDREDLISIIKNLENLTNDDLDKDLFKLFVKSYGLLRDTLVDGSNNLILENNIIKENNILQRPFGNSFLEIFSKVQALSGYGAALNFLIENEQIKSLDSIINLVGRVKINDPELSLLKILQHLDYIVMNARKIGNEQRMYFYYLIRSLFNENNEGYLNFDKSIDQANKFYKSNMLK